MQENGDIDSAVVNDGIDYNGFRIPGPVWVGMHYSYDAVIDINRDGNPDSYYDASNPNSLSKEITDILRRPQAVGQSPDMQDIFSALGGTEEETETAALDGELTFSLTASDTSAMDSLMESYSSMKTLTLRHVGGNTVANFIAIYPNDFDTKYLVTEYLDLWNGAGTVAGISENDRDDIKYTDTLELIIGLINGMIEIVTSALIAFTSISLVVSTVMIGIITYVSVVERIKEIGVIRSIGGRKKDVSHLFNAETFIIGLLAGLIGIGFTLIVSLVGSFILKIVTGISGLVSLKLSHAIILIILSVVLTLISGLIPAKSAARKDPIEALRVQ